MCNRLGYNETKDKASLDYHPFVVGGTFLWHYEDNLVGEVAAMEESKQTEPMVQEAAAEGETSKKAVARVAVDAGEANREAA